MTVFTDPALVWLRSAFGGHVARLRAAWRLGERGASAVELAIIAAFLAFIAVGLLLVIQRFVNGEGTKITGNGGRVPAP